MQIKDIILLLKAELLTDESKNPTTVTGAFASDLMSDVLSMVKNQNVLITGLCNPQALRTAELLDIDCVILVRGKKPDKDFIAMAQEKNICLIATEKSMYITCGILYSNGLEGVYSNE